MSVNTENFTVKDYTPKELFNLLNDLSKHRHNSSLLDELDQLIDEQINIEWGISKNNRFIEIIKESSNRIIRSMKFYRYRAYRSEKVTRELLEEACIQGKDSAVIFLVQWGALPTKRARDMAKENGNLYIADMLSKELYTE